MRSPDLRADRTATGLHNGVFELRGTSFGDTFDLALDDGQWMQASGGPGNDRFNMQGVPFRISYTWPRPRNGIDVDLAAGRANNNGFGNVDTYIGRVSEIRGTDLTDTIRGSGNDKSFIGRRGNDVIDGRGGWDRLRFDRTGVGNVVFELHRSAPIYVKYAVICVHESDCHLRRSRTNASRSMTAVTSSIGNLPFRHRPPRRSRAANSRQTRSEPLVDMADISIIMPSPARGPDQ